MHSWQKSFIACTEQLYGDVTGCRWHKPRSGRGTPSGGSAAGKPLHYGIGRSAMLTLPYPSAYTKLISGKKNTCQMQGVRLIWSSLNNEYMFFDENKMLLRKLYCKWVTCCRQMKILIYITSYSLIELDY